MGCGARRGRRDLQLLLRLLKNLKTVPLARAQVSISFVVLPNGLYGKPWGRAVNRACSTLRLGGCFAAEGRPYFLQDRPC